MMRRIAALLLLTAGCASAPAPVPAPPQVVSRPPAAVIREARYEDYTRYELLAPETAQFKIQYETAATAAGATAYFNPIRKGSEATDERVFDFATGKPLAFEVVSGATARQTGLADADLGTQYIRVALARPVPPDGLARLFIEKTYRDPKSYFVKGDAIVFARSLGVRRNSVVLPAGYEVIACNVPSQILSEPDGRIQVTFVNSAPDPASLILEARRVGP
ncbi:MAG: hypothetical protein ACRD00_01790 [Thermoanaerobaculia bacterium]